MASPEVPDDALEATQDAASTPASTSVPRHAASLPRAELPVYRPRTWAVPTFLVAVLVAVLAAVLVFLLLTYAA